jgi:hypothetical protein
METCPTYQQDSQGIPTYTCAARPPWDAPDFPVGSRKGRFRRSLRVPPVQSTGYGKAGTSMPVRAMLFVTYP